MVTILRPLSTSELLDRTFHLYRNNFVVFVSIVAIPQLAVLALQLPRRTLDARHLGGFYASYAPVWLASFLAIEIAHAATVMAVSNLHLGRPATIGSAYASARSSLLRVVGISLAVLFIPMLIAIPAAIVFAIIVGIVAAAMGAHAAAVGIVAVFFVLGIFLLGGLHWWLAWSLAVPVTVLEGGGVLASMRRSKALTKGRRGRIFVIYLLIAVLVWVVSAMVQLPFTARLGWYSFRHPMGVSSTMHVLSVVAAFLSSSLVGALGAIALTLVYYDERVRKEGFDLQLMVSTLEGTATSMAAAPAS